ncbi:MAG: hypothetical protein ACRD2C_25665 [Acidimicrobiales bacterium]
MNQSRRLRSGLWGRVVAVVTFVGVTFRAVAGELVVDVVGGRLGNVIVLVLIGTLAISLLSLGITWWVRTHRAPPTPIPGEDQPPAGVVEDLPNVARFVGRGDALHFATSNTEGVAAIVGRRGVGTSACVKKAALELSSPTSAPDHQARGNADPSPAEQPFPDGTHYLNLRRGNTALPPDQVIAALAVRFGGPVPTSGDAAEVERCAHALKERLAKVQLSGTDDSCERGERGEPGVRDRRALLVLDNLDDPAQIEALLPFPRRCRVLLAGCPELARHEDVTGEGFCWRLRVPTPGEAAAMFRSATLAAGDHAHRPDPRRDRSVRRLIELCGRMPRPVRSLAYHMALHQWPPDELLASFLRQIAAPAYQDVRYTEAFDLVADQDVAYTALAPRARRLYRRLSLAPGPLEPTDVAVLCRPGLLAALPWPRRLVAWAQGRTVKRTTMLVGTLAQAGLVDSPRGGCRIRDRYAPYAQIHLRRDESAYSRFRVELRLTRHLARRASQHADRLVPDGRRRWRRRRLDTGIGASCTWFDLHHRTLRKLVTRAAGTPGMPPEVQPRRLRRWWFQLAVATCTWYAAVGATQNWRWTCTSVLATPTAGDRWRISSWAHNELGVIHRRLNPARADELLAKALIERGHRGEAQVLTNLGLSKLDRNRETDDALWDLQTAARHRSPRDRRESARIDLGLGVAHYTRNELSSARDHLWHAVQAFDQLDDLRNSAAARTSLGLTYWQLGERQGAWQTLEQAVKDIDRLREVGGERLVNAATEAAARLNLGAVLVASEKSRVEPLVPEDASRWRRVEWAYTLLQRSLELREKAPSADRCRTYLALGDAASLLGRPTEAASYWHLAAAWAQPPNSDAAVTTVAAKRHRVFER